jgi:hypothetical protein
VLQDFAASLAEATVDSAGAGLVRNDIFEINGDQRRVLFEHPDSKVSYEVHIDEGAMLSFAVGIDPASWQQPGDGVTFAVYVGVDGKQERVFHTYIDPKQRDFDRRWHPYTVDLAAFAGRTVTIDFETEAGGAGDTGYDWAGWAEPRLWVTEPPVTEEGGIPWLLSPGVVVVDAHAHFSPSRIAFEDID